ncbi:MAG: hypothetical protein IJ179_02270 [Oscillospiraceae bacterium]|nr:hypothetical protein [Oscillospiraceae bacterium]
MPQYKKMYFHLFNAITDALKKLDEQDIPQAQSILIAAQQWGEDYYIETVEKTDN